MKKIRDILQEYYDLSPFGENGGIDTKYTWVYAGPYFIRITNTPSRKHLIRYHDIHHLLSGYDNSRIGEGEAGAWELGTNCWIKPHTVFLNLAAMATGLLYSPARIFKAFKAGSKSQNIYRVEIEELLNSKVGDIAGIVNSESGLKKYNIVIFLRLAAYTLLAALFLLLLLLYGFAFGKRRIT